MSSYIADFKIDGVPVEVTVDQGYEVIYSYSPEPDPDWVYVDKEGHRHYRDENGRLPTLYNTQTNSYWCEDCHDHHSEYGLFCRQCDEEITPGTRPPSSFGTPLPTYRDIKIRALGDLGEEFTYQYEDKLLTFRRVSLMMQTDDFVVSHYVMTGIQ